MTVTRSNADERHKWAVELENELLLGGASFSEWATLMSYEAYQCFTTGADIATIILCASCCETYLRTEEQDFQSNFYDLIENHGLFAGLTGQLHALRKSRNRWAHASMAKDLNDLGCYSEVYTIELELEAKNAYETMLSLLFSNPFV